MHCAAITHFHYVYVHLFYYIGVLYHSLWYTPTYLAQSLFGELYNGSGTSFMKVYF